VSENLPHKSGTNREPHLVEGVRDFVHIEIGLKTRSDDQCFDLLGAFGWRVGACPFRQKILGGPLEDRVAAVVIGFARLEAEARGKLVFGEAAEFSKGNHADFLLNCLVFGKGDGVAGAIGEHKRAVFDLNVEVESDPHDSPLPQGRVDDCQARCSGVYGIYAQNQESGLMGSGRSTLIVSWL
jgi:hypothetical protein